MCRVQAWSSTSQATPSAPRTCSWLAACATGAQAGSDAELSQDVEELRRGASLCRRLQADVEGAGVAGKGGFVETDSADIAYRNGSNAIKPHLS